MRVIDSVLIVLFKFQAKPLCFEIMVIFVAIKINIVIILENYSNFRTL